MTDNNCPPIQMSTQGGVKNVTFRANTGEELTELVTGFLKTADEAIEGLSTIEQVIAAKSALSNPAPAASPSAPKPTYAPRAVAPPTGDTPVCAHGPMKNIGGPPGNRTMTMAGKPYKAQYYCSYEGSDWKSKCKPVDA